MDVGLTHTPLGIIEINGANGKITAINYRDDITTVKQHALPSYIEHCIQQLHQYFQGMLLKFEVSVAPSGTEFQHKVWNALSAIPYGTKASYKDIAHKINCPKGFRAVGQANNRNPVSIIVPCHRVVASNGTLTGYAGGLWRKERLLELEQQAVLNKLN